MNAADVSSKNSTIGAGVPRIPCTRPAGCYTPAHACSRHASSIRYSTCLPATSTSPSKSPGASTRTSPGAYRDPNKNRSGALMQAEINTLTSTRVPRGLTELITLGRTLKRRAGDILAYFDHPTPATAPPKPSTAASNTYADPHSDSETSPTTSPEHSSKPEDLDPNYTPNYEEPVNPYDRELNYLRACYDSTYEQQPF